MERFDEDGWRGERNLLARGLHTLEEEGEEVVRIISAREATPHERREYEEGL